MKEINSVVNLLSCKKRETKFKKGKEAKIIDIDGSGEQPVKLNVIIDAQWKRAKNHMDHKDL